MTTSGQDTELGLKGHLTHGTNCERGQVTHTNWPHYTTTGRRFISIWLYCIHLAGIGPLELMPEHRKAYLLTNTATTELSLQPFCDTVLIDFSAASGGQSVESSYTVESTTQVNAPQAINCGAPAISRLRGYIHPTLTGP